ncbi:MAG: FlgD immunoglobulin-like domain containing protein [Alkalispirochaeta sp.]
MILDPPGATDDNTAVADAITIDTTDANDGGGTDGSITFQDTLDAVTAGADSLILDTDTADILFSGVVGGTRLDTLQVDDARNVTFSEAMSAVSVLQTTGTGTTTFNAAVDTTDDTTGIDITTNAIEVEADLTADNGGTITLDASVMLTADVRLDTTGDGNFTDGANITTTSTIDSDDGNNRVLILDAGTGGTVRLDGVVGGTHPLSYIGFEGAGALTSTLPAGSELIDLRFQPVYFDADGSTIILQESIEVGSLIFYRGTLDLGTNGVQLETINDFVVFGTNYDPDDLDRASSGGANNAYFAYPDAGSLSYYPADGTYDTGTGDFSTDPTASFTDLAPTATGTTITVGANFYVNGTDMTGSNAWDLALSQDNTSPDLASTWDFGNTYAAAFNMSVENSNATGASVAASTYQDIGTADVTPPTSPSDEGEIDAEDEKNNFVFDEGGNTGWDFSRPEIASAEIVRDNVIRLTFSEPIENSSNGISSLAGNADFRINGDTVEITDTWIDTEAPLNALPFTFASTDGEGDLTTFYVQVDPADSWNTDATGSTIGGANSTDSQGDQKNVVPDIAILKAELGDANGHNLVRNYNRNNSGTPFTATTDEAGPVLYDIRFGRARAERNPTTPYDGHNYFHLYYSEPVDIGSATGMTAAEAAGGTGAENVRSEDALGDDDDQGGDIRNSSGDILVDGYFRWSYNDPNVDGTMERGARDIGRVSANSLFRADTSGTDPFTNNAQELRIYLSGFSVGADGESFLGWHKNVPNPGTVTGVDVVANAALVDASPQNNAIDYQISTAVLSDSFTPEPTGATVAAADPDDSSETGMFLDPPDSPYYNNWDVIPPFFSSFDLDFSDANNETFSYEIVSLDTNNNGILDTIEFHMLDNHRELDYGNILEDFADNPQGAGVTLPEAADDRRPLWDPEDLSDTANELFTHPNERANEGIRDFTLTDEDNDPDPLTAFSIEEVGVEPLQDDTVSSFNTNVDNIFFGSVTRTNDSYFRVVLDESQHNWDLLTELYLTYSEESGRFTDLAGNLVPSTEIPIRAIERTPPRIEISLGTAGDDRLYLKFSEPVFGDDQREADIDHTDLFVPDNPPVSMEVIGRSTAPGSGEGGITEVFLTLTDPIEPDDAFSGRIRAATSESIFDKAQNPMQERDERRLTDVALGVIEPIWATDSFGSNDSGSEGGFRTLRDFDGGEELASSDITLQARLLTSDFTMLPVSLLYDLSVTDDDRVPDLIDPSETSRFWSPTPIPGLVSRSEISPARAVNAYDVDGILRTFTIPESDPEIQEGGEVEFMFQVGPLPAATLEDPSDPRTLAPWLFSIGDGFIVQRSNVTILNNVIYPERGENTVLVYEVDRPGLVTVNVFSLDGSVVRSLQRGRQGSGTYRTAWDGRNNSGDVVARGIYFVRVVAPGVDEYRKVIIAK